MMTPMQLVRQQKAEIEALTKQRDYARHLAARYEEIINQDRTIIRRYWERHDDE